MRGTVPYWRSVPKGEDRDGHRTGRRSGQPQPADPAEGTALRRATGVPPAVHAQLRRGRRRARRGRDLRAQDRGGGPGLPAEREPLRRRDRRLADLDGAATALGAVLPAGLAGSPAGRPPACPAAEREEDPEQRPRKEEEAAREDGEHE